MAKTIDAEKFNQLYESGLNDSQIARELGSNVVTIWKFRYKLGLPVVKERKQYNDAVLMELYPDGYDDCQIAKKLNTTLGIACRWRKLHRMPAHTPPKVNGYSLEKDYERILSGESVDNLIPLHAKHIAAFRKIEGKDMTMGDKVKTTDLPVHAIRLLTKVYNHHVWR